MVLTSQQVCVFSLSPTLKNYVTPEEQYVSFKFLFRLKKSSAQAYVMLHEAYEESVLPHSTARRWFKMFKEGRQSISKEGGRSVSVTALTKVNINTAAVIVREESGITLRDL
ncbi:hypothetical protein AVEN_191661-1 [Araneus ventricosus]|uniref:Mos1 transposase HTH domain-containing protein n=1 Tax=Araneus ventricosus TaxID=182803 RepID=A0A4Y2JWP0_ARAVE|nr:hypothetical protein AVEN_191661-1 [Araneus ventricosus]